MIFEIVFDFSIKDTSFSTLKNLRHYFSVVLSRYKKNRQHLLTIAFRTTTRLGCLIKINLFQNKHLEYGQSSQTSNFSDKFYSEQILQSECNVMSTDRKSPWWHCVVFLFKKILWGSGNIETNLLQKSDRKKVLSACIMQGMTVLVIEQIKSMYTWKKTFV